MIGGCFAMGKHKVRETEKLSFTSSKQKWLERLEVQNILLMEKN